MEPEGAKRIRDLIDLLIARSQGNVDIVQNKTEFSALDNLRIQNAKFLTGVAKELNEIRSLIYGPGTNT